MTGKRSNYVEQATLTLSDKFYTDKVNFAAFMYRAKQAITALMALDEVKKSLFYGRDFVVPPPNAETGEHDWRVALSFVHADPKTAEHIVHGIIGLATEAGELLEALYTAVGKERQLDTVNICEEVGDGKWYMAILAKACGFEWGADEAVNIAKLRARFPNAFTEHDANNRDLATERTILEGGETKRKHFGAGDNG